MERYEKPVMEIEDIDMDNVIVTSGDEAGGQDGTGEGDGGIQLPIGP